MEVIIKYYCFLLLICSSSCGIDKFEPDYTPGRATALKNDDTWIGQGRGTVNNQGIGLNFYFDVFDDLGQLRQRLSFSKIPILLNEYNLINTSGQATDSLAGCNFATLSFDGDVVEDRYKVVEIGNQSTIIVLDYNESERFLTGEFTVKLFIDPDRPKANPNNPDTILFEMGKFEVRIEE